MQHTARTFRNGDQLMISPGLGSTSCRTGRCTHASDAAGWGGLRWGNDNPCDSNTLYYLAADIDIRGYTSSARTLGSRSG